MPRQEKQLHNWRQPVGLRPAATLMLLRDAIDEQSRPCIEVLMTRRSMTASFAPGAYVFPGGALDEADGQLIGSTTLPQQVHESATVEALAVASIREAFEELGVLLVHLPESIRVHNLDRDLPLTPQLKACQGQYATDMLASFSHWQTDRDLPRRFDVRFFVARMPAGQVAIADEKEQFEPEWVNPAIGLARYERGEFNIIFPTIRTLRVLQKFASVDAAMAFARAQNPIPNYCPRAGLMEGKDSRHTHEEMQFGELELVAPDGQIVHELKWQSDRPVQLLKNVQRLTCPNPSMMTGPGTNTYIIGEPGAYIVVDPGPDIASHREKILHIVGNGLRWILCTHTHPDHHPGADALGKASGAIVAGIGMSARTMGAKPTWYFEPKHTIRNGEIFAVGDTSLKAIYTPGHASNHVCFLMIEDQLLISGDHILNGVTPVIAPPNGDMLAYLQSLEELKKEPFDFILPAHGYVLAPAKEAIDKLIAHRLKREDKVFNAFKKLQSGEPSLLVSLVYDDVDSRLHQLAQDSLLAHLIKLVKEGKVDHAILPKRAQQLEVKPYNLKAKGPIQATVSVPGSKSITNRAVLLAALAKGTSQLRGVLASDDTRHMITALRAMGVTIEASESTSDVLTIHSDGQLKLPAQPLFLGNAGTATRFLTAAVALVKGTVVVDGDEHMRKRPISPLVRSLQQLGIAVHAPTGCPPVTIQGTGQFNGTSVTIDAGVSSQFVSAILMLAPCGSNPIEVTIEDSEEVAAQGYIEITLQVMRAFGAQVARTGPRTWLVEATGYKACRYDIEPDASSSTYLWAIEALLRPSQITFDPPIHTQLQPDTASRAAMQLFPNMPSVIDGSQMQDAVPTLAVLAAFNKTPVRFIGIANLRVKECDRILALRTGLNQLQDGLALEQGDDLLVRGGLDAQSGLQPVLIDTFDDHRIAMSFALAGLIMKGVVIDNPSCVSKTYPQYWKMLKQLGIDVI